MADVFAFLIEGVASEFLGAVLAGLFGRARSPLAGWLKGLGWACLILAGGGTGLACWRAPVGPVARWVALVLVVAGLAALAFGFAARVANECVAPASPKSVARPARTGQARASGEA